ncbi:MAG: ParB domain protein nuclease [Herbinix sp.]|jgi:ParB family chromosome partitioning protein|nr:ParB domain protein nuclease [Herbinix sp.]
MAFNINNFLNAESKQSIKNNFKLVKVSVHKMRPAPDKENFYHIDDEEIEVLARTIELVGIQQNSVLKPIPDTDEFEIIAGHKRRLAVLKLIGEGKAEYEMMDCKIEESGDNIRNELILIFTNSTQRDRSDFEKMQEIKRIKELLVEYQKDNELPGKKQDIIAAILGTNKTKIGTLENIDHNLIEEFKDEFAAGKISTSAANEISGLTVEAQKALYETYQETGSLKAKEAKEKKEETEEQLPGQKNILEYMEALPEDLKDKVIKCAEENNVSLEEAAAILLNQIKDIEEEPREAQNEFNAINPPEEPEPDPEPVSNNQEAAVERPQETVITYNQPLPDRTDTKSLIINGRINPNKEYKGMKVNYFMAAVINSDFFRTEFWEGWKDAGNKSLYIAEYMGTKTTFITQTSETEKCEAVLFDAAMEVTRIAAGQKAHIFYEELADLIDVMIYTKVIEITTIESDLKYWAKRTVKDLESICIHLTENEIYVLQDIMMKCRERVEGNTK